MACIDFVTLEVADPTAAQDFYAKAFGLGPELRLRPAQAATSGFRGFTLSLTVSQPATVSALYAAALDAGATPLKPAAKSLWGFGGVVQAPDGTIWKIATSKKRDSGPATREIDKLVLLLGAEDVPASKRFYVDHGLSVARSFGRKYVEFEASRRRHARALRSPRPRQGRRRRAGRERLAPARHRQRRRAVHGPGRVRVGGRDDRRRPGWRSDHVVSVNPRLTRRVPLVTVSVSVALRAASIRLRSARLSLSVSRVEPRSASFSDRAIVKL